MKTKYDKKIGCNINVPETPLEAIGELQTFFECDMWFAKHNEWKTEKDMLKYLRTHFNIVRKQLKEMKIDGKTKK